MHCDAVANLPRKSLYREANVKLASHLNGTRHGGIDGRYDSARTHVRYRAPVLESDSF
jgi:hypothetical protein